MSLVNKIAPDFTAQAVVNGEIKDIRLSDYKGQSIFLFFYPLDFTFVCPTELHAFSDKMEEFEKRGIKVFACSVDSVMSHKAWLHISRSQGGIQDTKYPIISDITKTISRDYGVLLEDEGVALRGSFYIDRDFIVRLEQVYDKPIGRSVDEVLRSIDAWLFFEKHGEVCPINWKPGDQAMEATAKGLEQFFSDKYSH
ncbi:MAG: peroxiredoxin [Brevinemataceae bacterium]